MKMLYHTVPQNAELLDSSNLFDNELACTVLTSEGSGLATTMRCPTRAASLSSAAETGLESRNFNFGNR